MEGNISPYHHEMSWGGNSQGSRWQQQNNLRPVVPRGAGGAMAPPNFGRSVNHISTPRGADYAQQIIGNPGFSDLPTALCLYVSYASTHGVVSTKSLSCGKIRLHRKIRLIFFRFKD